MARTPQGNRLTEAGEVFLPRAEEIAAVVDEPLPQVRGSDPAWSAFWRIEPRPDGKPAPLGPVIDALEGEFELVAAGQVVAISAGRRSELRPDLIAIPLCGVEPSHVVLATRAGDDSRLLTAFCKYAEELLTGEPC
nr:hypothetical protein [Nocardia terpenica]